MAKINLDLTKVQAESQSLFSKVPAGDYQVLVAHSAFKEASTGGAGLIVGYMIESGEHKGKMIQEYLNIKNSNEKAVEMGFARLRLICELQGRTSFKLAEDKDLINKNTFMISTTLEDSEYNGNTVQNVKIKKLFAQDGSKKVEEKKVEVKEEKITTERLPWE